MVLWSKFKVNPCETAFRTNWDLSIQASCTIIYDYKWAGQSIRVRHDKCLTLLVIREIYKSDEPKKILETLSVFNFSK